MLAVPRPREGGLRQGENFWLRLTTASAQCLRLLWALFFIVLVILSKYMNEWKCLILSHLFCDILRSFNERHDNHNSLDVRRNKFVSSSFANYCFVAYSCAQPPASIHGVCAHIHKDTTYVQRHGDLKLFDEFTILISVVVLIPLFVSALTLLVRRREGHATCNKSRNSNPQKGFFSLETGSPA